MSLLRDAYFYSRYSGPQGLDLGNAKTHDGSVTLSAIVKTFLTGRIFSLRFFFIIWESTESTI